MFDVARSRLMCCSRIWSAMRSARLPRRSTETPMMRPGMLALEGFARGHVARAWTAQFRRRGAQTLGRADGDVGAPFAGGFQKRQRQQVGDGRDQRALGVGGGREVRVVARRAVGGRILDDGAELLAREAVFVVSRRPARSMPKGSLRVSSTSSVCGKMLRSTKSCVAALLDGFARAQGEHHQHRYGGGGSPSSSSEQLPISMPVSEITAVAEVRRRFADRPAKSRPDRAYRRCTTRDSRRRCA